MGGFKQETGERNLIIVLGNATKGGLHIIKWVDLFSGLLEAENHTKEVGAALCSDDGYMIERWLLNDELHSIMSKLKDSEKGLKPAGTNVDSRFNVYHS